MTTMAAVVRDAGGSFAASGQGETITPIVRFPAS